MDFLIHWFESKNQEPFFDFFRTSESRNTFFDLLVRKINQETAVSLILCQSLIEGSRTIPGQMLSETGYASEYSEDDLGSGTIISTKLIFHEFCAKKLTMKQIVHTNSLERREKAEREKVRVLENLKEQAVTLQEIVTLSQ